MKCYECEKPIEDGQGHYVAHNSDLEQVRVCPECWNGPEALLRRYEKTYKVGRLYFRYIHGTCLESDGWTAQKLFDLLLRCGLIEAVRCDSVDSQGRHILKNEIRWKYKTGKTISKPELMRLIYKEKAS